MDLGYNTTLFRMGRTSRKRQQRKIQDTSKLTVGISDTMTHLKSWLLTHNYLPNDNLILYDFPDTGRGFKTIADINNNEILIKLPLHILITTFTVSESYCKIFFSKVSYYKAQFILAVFLMFETHLGKQSQWYTYLETLPQSFNNPDFCSEREKHLLPDFILQYLHQSHKILNDFYILRESMQNLEKEGRNCCPHCNIPFFKLMTFTKYKWAYYVVNTRAVYIDYVKHLNNINVVSPNNLALAPLLDMFNHDCHAAVNAITVTDNNSNKFYQLTTLKPFKKESQVFINYGSHNNLKLYVEYGFFIPNNPFDEVYFTITDIQSCCNVSESVKNFIVHNNFSNNMGFTSEGLNYNAKVVLFLANTTLQKEQWIMKLYSTDFDVEDLINIYTLGIKVANVKADNLFCVLRKMKSHTRCSNTFLTAIQLVEEYINILNKSLKYMEMQIGS